MIRLHNLGINMTLKIKDIQGSGLPTSLLCPNMNGMYQVIRKLWPNVRNFEILTFEVKVI